MLDTVGKRSWFTVTLGCPDQWLSSLLTWWSTMNTHSTVLTTTSDNRNQTFHRTSASWSSCSNSRDPSDPVRQTLVSDQLSPHQSTATAAVWTSSIHQVLLLACQDVYWPHKRGCLLVLCICWALWALVYYCYDIVYSLFVEYLVKFSKPYNSLKWNKLINIEIHSVKYEGNQHTCDNKYLSSCV